jgi:hypothetical protein
MKPTKESHKLITFFLKNNCLLPLNLTTKTINLFKKFYKEIQDGVSYIENLKSKMGSSFFKLKIDYITNITHVPKPSTFPPNAFPTGVRHHIDEFSLSIFTYSFNLFQRNIQIIFTTEDLHPESLIDTYNNYVSWMLVWIYIVNEYASRSCSSNLKIYIYHTSLTKNLPSTNVEVLNEMNVNTAFTRTCQKDSEIVVFRKEEWFKVFIHETFHNFGLDFSDMNNSNCTKKILSIFPVNSDVNLYESYTEFWARMMNVLFCSYIHSKNNDIDEFLNYAQMLINFERMYSFFQMVKVLNFMDIQYNQLYQKNVHAENVRKHLYKENTNVLSYYIITLILINNYQGFLSWCSTNNTSILQFKKTNANLDHFCNFIQKNYKSKDILQGIDCTEKLLTNVKQKAKKQKNLAYILRNLRMTICELG